MKKLDFNPLIIALVILFRCGFLFYLDHETHSVSDLFTLPMLFVLMLYFVPTFIISGFLYLLLTKRYQQTKSLYLTLAIGVPSGIGLVMVWLYSTMKH